MKGLKDILPPFLRGKLAARLGIIILAVLIVEAISIVQYRYTRKLLDTELERRAELALTSSAQVISNTLKSAESTMQEHLWDIRSHLSEPDSMFSVTRRLIENNHYVVGGEIAFVPDYYPKKGRLFEPYAHKEDGGIVVKQLPDNDHDYTEHPAYIKTFETDDSSWSDPYFYGKGTDSVRLTTFTCPLHDDEGRFVAVCGLDIDLSWLSDTLNAHRLYPSSFGFLLTETGEPIVGNLSGQSDISGIVSLLDDDASDSEPGGNIRMVRFKDDSGKGRATLYCTSMAEDPYWKVAMVSYDNEVYEPAYRMRLRNLLLSLLGVITLFYIVHLFARGERNLQKAQIEQARIGSELHVARDIQMEMLPKVFPPFPDRDDIDIFGSLEPAREVGGDLFDFFIRADKLFFCIGDVSGKGVPSAMLMAVTHSLFRLLSEHNDDPAVIVRAINDASCRDNETNMFVTFFVGVLDLQTGHMRYCNAGHDHPVVVATDTQDLPVVANFPMGVFEGIDFEAQECDLPTGSTLFLYTDGVTEAKDVTRKQFTKPRMVEVLKREAGADAETLVKSVGDEVRRFTEGAEQSDDLTMLAIRYLKEAGETGLGTLTLKNDVRQVTELGAFIKSVAARVGLPDKAARNLRLAVEEAVVNAMSYAYPAGTEGDVTIDAGSDGRTLRVRISDAGAPFDPTAVGDVDTALPAKDRPIGGLGIHLMQTLADGVEYRREDERNILTINKEILT